MTGSNPVIAEAKNQFVKNDPQILQQLFGTDDIEPFRVGDMDFQIADAITEEFQRPIDLGVDAYESVPGNAFNLDWDKNRRYLWITKPLFEFQAYSRAWPF